MVISRETERPIVEVDPQTAYRHLFNEANDGLILIDPCAKRLLDVNPTAQRLSGFRKKQMLDMRLDELIIGDDLDRSLRLTEACESTCFFHSNEGYYLRRHQGEPLAVNVSVSRIHAQQGAVTLVTVRDVSERQRAHRLLAQHQNELAHAARLSTVGELVAGIAHEITQPISAITNYAGACLTLLEDCQVHKPSELGEYVREIEGQARRAAQIIHRLRKFTGKSPHERSTGDVNELVREAIAIVDAELRRHRITVALELAEPLPAILADRVQIQQVLVNLLMNAAEATEEHCRGDRQVTVRSTTSAEFIQIEVEDCGVGIAETKDTLFDTFFTTKPAGMGMGLSICRTIIDAHSGRIWAESNARGGATFLFTLPIFPGPMSDL